MIAFVVFVVVRQRIPFKEMSLFFLFLGGCERIIKGYNWGCTQIFNRGKSYDVSYFLV